MGTVPGEVVPRAVLLESVIIVVVDAALVRSTDCAAAIAAPGCMGFEEPVVGNPFSNSCANSVLGSLVVDNLALIGGLIGVGLAIPDEDLIT